MKNILITGGAGFIGANFVRLILSLESEVQIVNLDSLTYAGNKENLVELPHPERHRFVEGDIRDAKLVADLLRENMIDTIVHFAAETHVDRSILSPEHFVQTNIVGTFTLLEAALSYWDSQKETARANRFHHNSTDEVFGSLESDALPFTESAPYVPNSPYAASKAASDHLVRSYSLTYNMPVTITNSSNNYGPYQFPEKLIPLVILNALEGKPIPIYGDGKQIRDWLHVEDHCHAIRSVLHHGQIGETYNVGGDVQVTNLTIIKQICSLIDTRFPDSPHAPHAQLIEHVADRPGHDRRYGTDISKIRQDIGWQPGHSLESGLEKTVDWFLSNNSWWQAIRTGEDYIDWIKRNYDNREEYK